MPAFLDQHRVSGILREDACLRSDLPNNGSADENGLYRAGPGPIRKAGIGIELNDSAVDLPSICIAFNREIHQAEALLFRIGDTIGQQDCTGAGAKYRLSAAKLRDRFQQVLHIHQLEHSATFAAGNNQPVQMFQVIGRTHVHRFSTGSFDCFPVGLEITLKREDTYLLHMAREVWLPASCLHQFALGNLGDLETRHADAEFFAGLKQLLRVLVISRRFDDGARAELRISGLEYA